MMQRYISEEDLQTFVDTQMQSFDKTLALAEKVNSKQVSEHNINTKSFVGEYDGLFG